MFIIDSFLSAIKIEEGDDIVTKILVYILRIELALVLFAIVYLALY